MPNQRTQFTALMRMLHWTMAAMVLTHARRSASPWSPRLPTTTFSCRSIGRWASPS